MNTLAKWTIDDYHQMIATGILDDRPVELLNGEIVEMAPEGPPHTFYSEGFAAQLRSRLAGRAWIREARPITLDGSEPEPDVAVVRSPREQYRDRHPYPADIFLVIEVSASSLANDLDLKQKIYAAAGIPEYWVIDLTTKCIIVFRLPETTGYQSRQDFSTGTIAPLAFPDVAVVVEQLLA